MTALEELISCDRKIDMWWDQSILRLQADCRMVHETEVHAYVHIKKELLEKKGWKKRQVYTQNEIRRIKPIVEQLGQTTPENIVMITETKYYVIESKSKQNKLHEAITEAQKDYGDKINNSKEIKCLFITGVAGNDDEGYIATSKFYKDGKWITITENDTDVTGILSKSEIERILESDDPHLKDVEISEEEFLKTAEEINSILHENSINKEFRARFISAILLALSEKTPINLDEEPALLVNSINNRVDLVLTKHKRTEFANYLQLNKLATQINHIHIKNAIVRTVQELNGINIRAAMKSGKDVLGQFYEVFLKYGNGAKEIGIVLTPRHITRFAAEVLDIQWNDLVLDPTCGTGGFLVAAFDKVKRETDDDRSFKKFKDYGLYGLEKEDQVVALALVNMVFRGDGKNNIKSESCFHNFLHAKSVNGHSIAEYKDSDFEGRIPAITKVLMNPPFPQKKKKSSNKGYEFVQYALQQMQDEGLLFSILQTSEMIDQKEEKNWRKDSLLKNNTLLAVITFPSELFNPTANVHTLGIIVKKGIPHHPKQKVFWLKASHDGFIIKKSKRIKSSNERDMIAEYTPILKEFIKTGTCSKKNIPEEFCIKELDQKDLEEKGLTELVPEAYLESKIPSEDEVQRNMDKQMRELVSFMIRFGKEEYVN